MQLKSTFLSLFVLSSTVVNGQSSAPNLTSILSSTSELSSLAELLSTKPGLLDIISNWPTNVTILAPDNEAFEELTKMNNTSQDSSPTTGEDVDTIEAILSYHILNGTFYSSAFVDGETAVASTLLGNNSFANLNNNASQVVFGRKDGGDSDDVSLYSGLGKESEVERVDIQFDKGVIHIIDRVLTLPSLVSKTAIEFGLTAAAGALVRTGLLDTVDNTPSLTIFAPNNAAFQAIGNLLTDDTNEHLSSVLKYHMVNQTIYDLSEAENQDLVVASLEGGDLTIHEVQGAYFVNGARIIGGKEGGVVVANGVVYVIDSVLNPANGVNDTTFTPNPTASTQTPAFSSASFVTEVPFTTEIVSGTPTSTETTNPTETDNDNDATSLKAMPVNFQGLAVILIMAGFGGFFLL